MKKKLTGKQEIFCQEYLIDLNATQAAIRTGYSRKSARNLGSRNLDNPNIRERLAELQRERSYRTQITQDRVLQEYARIAFLDPRKLFDGKGNLIPVAELDEDTARAIASIDHAKRVFRSGKDESDIEYTKKIRLLDKKGALDSCSRHLGMFTDNVNVSGNLEIKVDKYL